MWFVLKLPVRNFVVNISGHKNCSLESRLAGGDNFSVDRFEAKHGAIAQKRLGWHVHEAEAMKEKSKTAENVPKARDNNEKEEKEILI